MAIIIWVEIPVLIVWPAFSGVPTTVPDIGAVIVASLRSADTRLNVDKARS